MAMFSGREFHDSLVKQLNAAMLEAAEPHIEAALKKIEAQMRTRLASMLIGQIDKSMNINYMGETIQITLRQPNGDRQ